jgi:predicted secreted protein
VHRLKLIAVAAVIGLAVAGSAFAYRVVRVGPAADGKTFMVHPSDRLVVTLPGNASTGYSWKLLHVDSSVVKFVSRSYVAKPIPPKVGAGGAYVLRFRAAAIGTTKLKLGYIQAGSSKSAKTFSLKLVVRSPAPRV